MAKSYRKRYERSKEPPPFRLQDRDVELLALLAQYRFMNVPIIRLLQPWGLRNLRRRLEYLFEHGLVNRPRGQYVPLATPQPLIYSLSNAGARLLMERLEVEKGRAAWDTAQSSMVQALRGLEDVKLNVDWNENSGRAKLPYIEHALMIARFRAALTAALWSRDDVGLAAWRQGPELKGTATVDGESIPVVPDALFTLEEGEDLLHFCLEADRGTMSTGRYLAKLRGYWQWFREGGHQKLWGINAAFRVLTLTTSGKRRDNLRALAREVDRPGQGSRMFLFASDQEFDLERPETLLADMWQCGADGWERWHRLLE